MSFARNKIFDDWYVNRIALMHGQDPLVLKSYSKDRQQQVVLVNNDNGEEGDLQSLETEHRR